MTGLQPIVHPNAKKGHTTALFLKIANFNRLSGLAVDGYGREYLPKVLWFGIWTAR